MRNIVYTCDKCLKEFRDGEGTGVVGLKIAKSKLVRDPVDGHLDTPYKVADLCLFCLAELTTELLRLSNDTERAVIARRYNAHD